MIVRTTSDPATFKELVFPFLQRDPVLNTVILGNTADRVHGILADPEPPVFVSVHDGDEVVGAVLSTALRGQPGEPADRPGAGGGRPAGRRFTAVDRGLRTGGCGSCVR